MVVQHAAAAGVAEADAARAASVGGNPGADHNLRVRLQRLGQQRRLRKWRPASTRQLQ